MAADPRLRRSGSVASRGRLPDHREFLAEGQEQADRPSGRPAAGTAGAVPGPGGAGERAAEDPRDPAPRHSAALPGGAVSRGDRTRDGCASRDGEGAAGPRPPGARTARLRVRRQPPARRGHRGSARVIPTERNTLMPETFSTQLGGLAGYADRNASLAPAAALRRRAARRTLRRRGGAAALLGGALAIVISLGVTNTGVVMPAHSAASSPPESVQSPGSVRLTSY